MASGQEELLFGRLALHYKLITAGQLEEVHGLHNLAGGRRQLPEILVEMGYLSQRQVDQLLVVQRDYLEKRRAGAGQAAALQSSAAPAASPPQPSVAATSGPDDTMAAPGAAAAPAQAESAATATAWAGAAGGQRELDAILALAVERGASDIHIHSGAPIGLRLAGSLVDLDPQPLAPEVAARMIEEVLDDEQRAALARHGQVDFAHTLPGRARFRANAYRQQRGLDAVFRSIPSQPPTLQSLGLPESLARLADYHQGMVLITGPGGCGKSATMAALISIINQTRADHVVTIEDPIEYLHPSLRAIVNQRQVGPHTASFARALRAALREDPDVIAIGELRDSETISLAITAAETGHLVFGTLHTNNAVRTINRMLGVFPPSQQAQMRAMIAESLRAVVSQRLLARADGRGRVPVLEMLIVTKAAANLIRDNRTFQIRSILQTGAAQGMIQLDAALAELVRNRVVTRDEALLHAEDPTRIP